MAPDPGINLEPSPPPTAPLEASEGWRLLRRHFELTEGFSFIVVVAPDDWAIAQLRPRLPTILPAAAGWLRVVFDPAAPFEKLSEQLLQISPPAGATLIWIDADPGDPTHHAWWEERKTAWKRALARLNRYRNTLQARFSCTLALAGPAGLIEVLRESAPDLWAIRSGVFRIEPLGSSKELLARSIDDRRILEHVDASDQGDAAETLAEAAKLRDKPGREALLVQLLIRASSQAQNRFQWELAIRCLEEAYTLEQTHGTDPQVRLALAIRLSLLFLDVAQYERGLFYAVRALDTAERFFGPDTAQTAVALNNLAQLFGAMNRLDEAEPLMLRALAIDEQRFGPEHPNVARDLNNLAQLLQDTNRLAEAEPLKRRALAIDKKSLGPEHPNVAVDLNNLAQWLKSTNRLAEAEPLMRQALAIDEKSLGPEHPSVARDLNNLAQLLKDTNRHAEAEPLMRQALAIDEKRFGPAHPDVAIDLNNLGQMLRDTNRLAEAEPLMRRALAIDEQSVGPEHPNVARDLNNLAMLLQDTNRLVEAEPLMQRALALMVDSRRRTGHAHPKLNLHIGNYRQLLAAMGRNDAEIEAAIRQMLEGTPETG